MKKFIFFAHVFTWSAFFIPAVAQAQIDNPYTNYVVIGAFASRNNAIHFTKDANSHNFPAQFEMNFNRNLFYVYVLTTADREVAVLEALKLRNETKYFDTWVYNGLLGKERSEIAGFSEGQMDIDPATGRKIVSIESRINESATNGLVISSNRQMSVQPTQTDPAITNSKVADPAGQTVETTESGSSTTSKQESQTAALAQKPLSAEDVVGKDFIFRLFRASNNAVVEGDIEAIDSEKSRRMATYKGNTPVKVLMPAGNSKRVSFVSTVFGYRKLQKEFDPDNPSKELSLDEDGNLVVPFELVRLQKGDIAIMYNVFFFNDAAVMRPESRYEVNNLLELLNENPSYKIKIHGHTNGSASGKIIRKEKPDNFFSLTNTKDGLGSARKLSEERALVVKQYLISQDVDEDRIQIKAWGGKRPIHDKNSARANENVRVEVEILPE